MSLWAERDLLEIVVHHCRQPWVVRAASRATRRAADAVGLRMLADELNEWYNLSEPHATAGWIAQTIGLWPLLRMCGAADWCDLVSEFVSEQSAIYNDVCRCTQVLSRHTRFRRGARETPRRLIEADIALQRVTRALEHCYDDHARMIDEIQAACRAVDWPSVLIALETINQGDCYQLHSHVFNLFRNLGSRCQMRMWREGASAIGDDARRFFRDLSRAVHNARCWTERGSSGLQVPPLDV